MQALGVLFIVAVSERIGIPVITWVKKLLKFDEASLSGKMDRLSSYYNHDTTEKLERLIQMEEKEHEANDNLRSTLKDISNALSNLDKYGVHCRKD